MGEIVCGSICGGGVDFATVHAAFRDCWERFPSRLGGRGCPGEVNRLLGHRAMECRDALGYGTDNYDRGVGISRCALARRASAHAVGEGPVMIWGKLITR